MKPLSWLFSAFLNGRFGILLASLFCLLFLAAFAQESRFIEEMFLAVLCMILVASLHAVEPRAHDRRIPWMMVLGTIAVFGGFIGYFFKGTGPDLVMAFSNLFFLAWVIAVLFTHIFGSERVTVSLITGAACLYILLGITFGFLYFIIDFFLPHSFYSLHPDHKTGVQALLGHFFYYSFVTLATVGYGDITPVSQAARYVSIIEALMSQLYLTIMVARLVGLHLNHDKGS